MKASLFILIDGKAYKLERIVPDFPEVKIAWRIFWKARAGHEGNYVVVQDERGTRCECPDFLWRREFHGDPCKHIMALEQVGLLQRRIE